MSGSCQANETRSEWCVNADRMADIDGNRRRRGTGRPADHWGGEYRGGIKVTEPDYTPPASIDWRQRRFSTQISTQKGSAAELRWCISWSQPPTGVASQSVLPAFQAGHAGSIPVARSSSSTISDLALPYARFQAVHRAASLPIRYFSSSITVLELSFVNGSVGWTNRCSPKMPAALNPQCPAAGEDWCRVGGERRDP